jgi:hypothetical protein
MDERLRLQTFRPSRGSYSALCGVLSVPLVICVGAAVSRGRLEFTPLLLSIAFPVSAAIWLSCFRLRIDDDGVEYRELGRSFKVAYSDVISLQSRRVSYVQSSAYSWVLHLHDGRELRLNLKPFPREAYRVLCERIPCNI